MFREAIIVRLLQVQRRGALSRAFERRLQLSGGVLRTPRTREVEGFAMTQALERNADQPAFVAAAVPPAVIRAVERVVRSRPDVTEAHLAGMRLSRNAAAGQPALIVVSEDATVVTSLERALRYVLKAEDELVAFKAGPGAPVAALAAGAA